MKKTVDELKKMLQYSIKSNNFNNSITQLLKCSECPLSGRKCLSGEYINLYNWSCDAAITKYIKIQEAANNEY